MKKLIITLCFFVTMAIDVFAEPVIIYVSPTGSSEVSVDGLSWTNAVSLERGRNLVSFYNNQNPVVASEIWAKAGTYNLTADAFQMTIPMSIYGGFVGNETLRTQRNWKVNQTILHQTNATKGVIYSNVEADATLDGWILENGNKTSAGSCGTLYPGGTLRNCFIRNNKTTGSGVLLFTGIAGSTKKMTIDNCLIINNECSISPMITQIQANALVDIINTTIANNYCAATSAGVAIGINVATGVTFNLVNSIFYGNLMGDLTTPPTSVAATNAVKNLFNNAWDVAATNGTRTDNIVLTASPYKNATAYVGVANGTTKLFSEMDTSDFSLKSGSTCINAGNNSYVTSGFDLASNARISNTTVDMGCYEYSVSTSLSNPKISGLAIHGSRIMLPENAIGKTVRIFNTKGIELDKFTAHNNNFYFNHQGVFIVQIGADNYKIIK